MSLPAYRCPVCKADISGPGVRQAAAALGSKGGKAKSDRKAVAARANLAKARDCKAAKATKDTEALIEKVRVYIKRLASVPAMKRKRPRRTIDRKAKP